MVENEEIFEEFSCKCPPFFYGNQCELFTTPDFVFEFERSSINNYVKLPGPEKDLNAISFCAWIQTKDQFNYGSIISYATKDQDNAFTFTDYNGFVLYVNGVNTITDIKIIDDIWHFLCCEYNQVELNIKYIFFFIILIKFSSVLDNEGWLISNLSRWYIEYSRI